MFVKKFVQLREDPGPDCGWSWVVLCSAFMMGFCSLTIQTFASFMYPQIMITYRVDLEVATLPFYLRATSSSFIGLFGAFFVKHLSALQMVFAYNSLTVFGYLVCYLAPQRISWLCLGLTINGVGVGLMGYSLPLFVTEYFSKRIALAQAISFNAFQLSSIFQSFLTIYLLEEFDVRGCFLILAGVVINSFVFGLFLIDRTPFNFPILRAHQRTSLLSKKRHDSRNNKSGAICDHSSYRSVQIIEDLLNPLDKSQSQLIDELEIIPSTELNFFERLNLLCHRPVFIVVLLCLFVPRAVHVTLLMIFYDHLLMQGHSPWTISTLLSVMVGITVVLRVPLFWLIDQKYFTTSTALLLTILLMSFGMSLESYLPRSLPVMILVIFVYGISFAFNLPIGILVTIDVLGQANLPVVLSIVLFLNGITAAASPSLIGFLFALDISYFWVIATMNVSCILCSIVWSVFLLAK